MHFKSGVSEPQQKWVYLHLATVLNAVNGLEEFGLKNGVESEIEITIQSLGQNVDNGSFAFIPLILDSE